MNIIKNIDKMKIYSRIKKKDGKMIGFVPTMGYLHEGHMSLINAAKKQTDIVVLSIFVNPLQFGPDEDYAKYPRDMERDEEMLNKEGVDVVFYPDNDMMYPEGYSTYVNVKNITENLCGMSRPAHFDGVATVVTKLFNIIDPDIAYFGQKDAQQAAIVKRVVGDLNMGILIKVLPVIRESDGLAMSSRNAYLDDRERKDAAVLYNSLRKAEELFNNGESRAQVIIKHMEGLIRDKETAKIDYIKVVDAQSLKDIKMIKDEALVALAVYIGKTRLIDNTILGGKKNEI